ncbi:MAG: ATP-dependent RNA helicase RhlB [Oleispira sp.]|nr:ATP-dependent RNA helicase RhlB [Oleispira sp.]
MFKKIISAFSGKAQGSKSLDLKGQDKKTQGNNPKNSKPHANKDQTHDRSKHENKPHKAAQKQDFKPSAKGNQKHQAEKKAPVVNNWKLSDFVVEAVEGQTRFHDMQLPDSLMQGIHESGFKYCTPIQAQSLPAALKGSDILGQAQTGTGKSAAFLTAVINRLLTEPLEERFASEPRALIVAPTRELVMQIGKDASELAKYTGLKVVTIVGGMDYEEQRRQLRDHVVDILVATPGRLIDFMGSQDVYLDEVDILVLDEADRMLDMGFIPDVRRIERATPTKGDRQTLFFSATFNDAIRRLIDQWTHEPVEITIEPEQVATDNIDQKFLMVAGDEKFDVLCNYLREEKIERAIIFANRRDITRKLCDRLNKKGLVAGLLSGEVNQQKRIKTLERFRDGSLPLLVATDVAGRGIHVDGVSHVFNYNLPDDAEDYVHRIGRTGRAGTKGISIALISEDDAFELPALEEYLGTKLKLEQPR